MQPGCRCRGTIFPGTVRPNGVVFQPPSFNQYLGLFQGMEDFTLEQLIPELSVETLKERTKA